MKKTQHVTPIAKNWQVKGAGNKKATKIFNTQYEAISYAKKIAQKDYAKDEYYNKLIEIYKDVLGEKNEQ